MDQGLGPDVTDLVDERHPVPAGQPHARPGRERMHGAADHHVGAAQSAGHAGHQGHQGEDHHPDETQGRRGAVGHGAHPQRRHTKLLGDFPEAEPLHRLLSLWVGGAGDDQGGRPPVLRQVTGQVQVSRGSAVLGGDVGVVVDDPDVTVRVPGVRCCAHGDPSCGGRRCYPVAPLSVACRPGGRRWRSRRRLAHSPRQVGVLQQPRQGRGGSVRVVAGNDDPRCFVLDYLGGSVRVGDKRRTGTGRGLQHRHPEALPATQGDVDVQPAQQIGDLRVRDRTQEIDAIPDSEPGG